MIRLRTLGGVDLHDAHGAEVRPLLAQPKRLALLVHLALARPRGYQRRDTLLALFWPELDAERARNSLRQAVHFLRRVLGADAVPSRGTEELGIDTGRLWCDATVFEAALDAGELEPALELYGGDLLPGFFVSDVPAFDEWLDRERGRLRDRAADAAWRLSAQADAARDGAAATRWARRAVGLTPDDERGLRRLLELHLRLGDRAGALRAYDEFAARLEREFGVTPAPETVALLGTARARVAVSPAPDVVVPVPAAPAPPSPARPRRPWLVAAAAVVLAGTSVAGAILWTGRLEPAAVTISDSAVAVLPFTVRGDTGLRFLSEGLVDLLSLKLDGVVGLRAIEPRAVLAASRTAGRPLITPADGARLARRLGAGTFVMGDAIEVAGRVRLTAALFTHRDATPLARATVDGEPDQVLGLLDELTLRLLSQRFANPDSLARVTSFGTRSLPALQAFLAGRTAYRHGQLGRATHAFRQAVALDSTFAEAALHLADVGAWTMEPDVAALRQRAWQLRGRLSPGLRAYLVALFGRRFPNATPYAQRLQDWERAIAAGPNRPEAWYELGDLQLHLGGATPTPRQAWIEARAAFRRAVALDSTYTAPLTHLIQMAARDGDSTALTALWRHYQRYASPDDETADFLRWRVAYATGDSVAARRLRAGLARMPSASLLRIALWSPVEGVGVRDGMRAMGILQERSRASGDPLAIDLCPWLCGSFGWLGAHRASMRALWDYGEDRENPRMMPIWDALFYGGDSLAAERAVTDVLRRPPVRPLTRLTADYFVTLWQLWHGRPLTRQDLAALARELRRAGHAEARVRALLALASARRGPSSALAQLAAIDSLPEGAWEATPTGRVGWFTTEADLVVARAYEVLHSPEAALQRLERMPYDHWMSNSMLAGRLLMIARVAPQAGDTAAALRAYDHYLALLVQPDRELMPAVTAVRRERDRLAAAWGRPVTPLR
jgi:DNA-binding SARP family transcriptional activator/TolB-like protein/Tfp pilus assembly protein PilF